MALIGSLTTAKPLPKDADVLVTIEDGLDLGPLARAAPALEGNGAANEPMRRDISRSTSVECGIQYFHHYHPPRRAVPRRRGHTHHECPLLKPPASYLARPSTNANDLGRAFAEACLFFRSNCAAVRLRSRNFCRLFRDFDVGERLEGVSTVSTIVVKPIVN